MSHETIGPERSVVYTMPLLPSDALRSMRFDQFFEQYRGSAQHMADDLIAAIGLGSSI